MLFIQIPNLSISNLLLCDLVYILSTVIVRRATYAKVKTDLSNSHNPFNSSPNWITNFGATSFTIPRTFFTNLLLQIPIFCPKFGCLTFIFWYFTRRYIIYQLLDGEAVFIHLDTIAYLNEDTF